MDVKETFVFYWMPKFINSYGKPKGQFSISPSFCTIYSKTAIKWRIIFYPNGGEHDTSGCCAIYLQQIDFSRRKNHIEADVEFQLFPDGNTDIWSGTFTAKFRCIDIKMLNLEGVKGLPAFGPALRKSFNKLMMLTDGRILIRCSLRIPIADFLLLEKDAKLLYEIPVNEEMKTTEKADDTLTIMSTDSRSDLVKQVEAHVTEPDVTLVANDGQKFLCHSEILGQHSDVLLRMFKSGLRETDVHGADVDDLDGETLNELFAYLYTHRLSQKAKSLAPNLLYAAEKYMIADLKPHCEVLMMQMLTKHNAWTALENSETFDLKDLKSLALQTIVTNYEYCLQSEEYIELRDKHSDLMTLVLQFACQRAIFGLGAVASY